MLYEIQYLNNYKLNEPLSDSIIIIMKTKFEISAGGVVYKKEGDNYSVLLIAVKKGTVWTLPKGLVEKGEKPEEAALREIREETGIIGELESFLDKIELWFFQNEDGEKVRHHKIVYYYLVKYVNGNPVEHDFEVEDVKWFQIDEAVKICSYEKDREVLKKAKEILEKNNV